MKRKIRIFNKVYNILKAAKPLLIAHHPICSRFESHLIYIKNHPICLGCITVYPTFVISLLIFHYLSLQVTLIPIWHLIPLGIMLTSLKIFDFKIKSIKIIINILIGMGLSILVLGILGLPFTIYFNIIILLIILLLSGLVTGYKMDKNLRVCTTDCEYQRDWSRCPGLCDVYCSISKTINNET